MQIQLESQESHTIQSYSDQAVQVDSILYRASVIISREHIISWPVHSLNAWDATTLDSFLISSPEIIIIGHNLRGNIAPAPILEHLVPLKIGLECMGIGAACRTFNVLLSEQRAVVLGLIFP